MKQRTRVLIRRWKEEMDTGYANKGFHNLNSFSHKQILRQTSPILYLRKRLAFIMLFNFVMNKDVDNCIFLHYVLQCVGSLTYLLHLDPAIPFTRYPFLHCINCSISAFFFFFQLKNKETEEDNQDTRYSHFRHEARHLKFITSTPLNSIKLVLLTDFYRQEM